VKKEVFFSITIGILLGLGVMGIIWVKKQGGFQNLSLKNLLQNSSSDQSSIQENQSLSPTLIEKNNDSSIKLSILEPTNESVVSKEKITVKGETAPLSTVVIIWEEGEDILVADEQGIFETQVTLVGGPNQIEITAYDDKDNEKSESLLITYSTAKF